MPRLRDRVCVRVPSWSAFCAMYDRNLSLGGIGVSVAGRPPAIGDRLELVFRLPDGKRLCFTGAVKHRLAPKTTDNPGGRWFLAVMLFELDPLLSRTVRLAREQS